MLTQVRLKRAGRLLRATKQKLAVIAAACGFGDRINLYRQFRQHYRVSPGAYRKGARPAGRG